MLNKLITPAVDGGVLLLPPADRLPEMLQTARDRLKAMDFTVAGVPAAQLRRQAREELAAEIGADLPAPWIATGHQSEMHHAGVWFKDAAAAAWAEAVEGSAVHVVADLDTLGHMELSVPRVRADGALDVARARFARPSGRQCPAQLPAPSAEAADELVAAGGAAGVFEVWAAAARRRAGQGTLAEWITAGRAAVNESLGLAVHDVYWSRMIRGRAFGRFAAAVCLDAERVFTCHAEALAAHRSAYGITNPTQPAPDLHRYDGAVEVPLWVFRPGGSREPLRVRHVNNALELLTPAGSLAIVPDEQDAAAAAIVAMIAEGTMIAPRALTLTMYLRAFVVDVFIHGTGGSRYDVLGDDLTRRWLGWPPPPFATATATLRLDLPRFDVTAADRSQARWNVHHAWHNPYARANNPSARADALQERKVDAADRRRAAVQPRACRGVR